MMEAVAQAAQGKVLKRSEDFNKDTCGCCTSTKEKKVTREARTLSF